MIKNVHLSDIKPIDCDKFISWLMREHQPPLSHNVAQDTADEVKRFFEFCIANNWLTRNPFVKFKPNWKLVTRNTLTEDELHRMATVPLPAEIFDRIRDCWQFAVLTALLDADQRSLRASDFHQLPDGQWFIHKQRGKTKQWATIPVLPETWAILRKYNPNWPIEARPDGGLLPLPANATVNKGLKFIAMCAAVNKAVKFKDARNSGATLLRAKGVPIDLIARWLGHADSTRTAETYYVKIGPETVLNAVFDAFGIVSRTAPQAIVPAPVSPTPAPGQAGNSLPS